MFSRMRGSKALVLILASAAIIVRLGGFVVASDLLLIVVVASFVLLIPKPGQPIEDIGPALTDRADGRVLPSDSARWSGGGTERFAGGDGWLAWEEEISARLDEAATVLARIESKVLATECRHSISPEGGLEGSSETPGVRGGELGSSVDLMKQYVSIEHKVLRVQSDVTALLASVEQNSRRTRNVVSRESERVIRDLGIHKLQTIAIADGLRGGIEQVLGSVGSRKAACSCEEWSSNGAAVGSASRGDVGDAGHADGIVGGGVSPSDVQALVSVGTPSGTAACVGEGCSAETSRAVDQVLQGLKDLEQSLGESLSGQLVVLRKEIWSETQQVGALLELSKMTKSSRLLPSFGRWAIDARSMLHLLQVVEDYPPANVLELGSGTSTVWLASQAEEHGFHIFTVDHDAVFLEQTRRWLVEHNLISRVTLILAPLVDVEVDGDVFRWYDDSALILDSKVDLMVVDGPPNVLGRRTRYPALPRLIDRLSANAIVMLHDSDRRDEALIVRQWVSEFGEFFHDDRVVSRFAVLQRNVARSE